MSTISIMDVDHGGVTSMVRVAAAQIRVSNNMEENYLKGVDFIRRAAAEGAKFVCFPEGQLSHYLPQYPGLDMIKYAVGLSHRYVAGFCAACRETGIIASVALCLDIEGKIYASNLIISEKGEILGVGKKNHIVQTEHFYEQDYFTPSQEGFCVVNTSIGRIGMIVCFDRHYPESFRSCVLKGADFIVVPVANEKIEPSEVFQWEMRIPAFQNSVNVVMCNRVGVEGSMDFSGETVFVRPDGSVAALAGDQEQLLFADLDLAGAAALRNKKQYLKLRRPEAFVYDA